jgi:adenylate kinase
LIEKEFAGKGDILLDGLPRNMIQAKWILEKFGKDARIHIIYLNLPSEIMEQRIAKRLGEGSGRADDADKAAVIRRLDVFQNLTMPAIEFYKNSSDIIFYDIDDVPSPAELVYADIKKQVFEK